MYFFYISLHVKHSSIHVTSGTLATQYKGQLQNTDKIALVLPSVLSIIKNKKNMNKYTIEIINVCSTWHGNIRDIPNSSLDVPLFLIDQSILIHTLKKFNISRQKQKT